MRRLGIALVLLAIPLLARAESAYDGATRVQQLLKTTLTASGQPIVYPHTEQPEVTALRVEIPEGSETGWHVHPVPGYAYIQQGSLEVETADGKKRRYGAGQALAEIVNAPHNGRSIGKGGAKLIVFFTGERGKPFTQRVAAPTRPPSL
jgi:quercetin dioxygenase-like cupin family protein